MGLGGAVQKMQPFRQIKSSAAFSGLLSCAATVLMAAAAADAAVAAPPLPGASAALAYPVDRFYAARSNTPLWLRQPNGTGRFLNVLRSAQLEGFDRGPELAEHITAAMRRASGGDPLAVREAERLISAAWIQYVQAISWPARGIIYGDQSLAPRIPQALEILQAAAEAPSLEHHVDGVSTANPIHAQLRQAALRARLTGDKALERRIVTNMQRARALPASGRYILIDIATARLWMFEEGQVRDTMKVVVGKPDQQTPLIASTVRHATLNPYWHVPVDMVQRTIAPNVLREGVGYLRARGYEVVSDYTESAQPIAAESIDWKSVAQGLSEARVRQRPGGSNAMGDIKITFPNTAGIYLHDTPDKALFAKDRRTSSGGCIRLEDARRLTRWLLGRDPVRSSEQPEQRVDLPAPVPVYLTYLTVHPRDGGVEFAEDVYGFDETVEGFVVAG